METVQSTKGASVAKVRVIGIAKFVRNLCIFLFYCYAADFNSSSFAAFACFIYFTWKYIPEIATGVDFERTSVRARGVTILLGFVSIVVLIIFVFVTLTHPGP